MSQKSEYCSQNFLSPDEQERQLKINKIVLAHMVATDFQQLGIQGSSEEVGSELPVSTIQQSIVETLSQRSPQDLEEKVRRKNQQRNRMQQIVRDSREDVTPHVA